MLDPKVMEELHLSTGDVIEISSKAAKKKTFALLWSSQLTDYGADIIRIDGYPRNSWNK